MLLVLGNLVVSNIIPITIFSYYMGVDDTLKSIQFPNTFILKDFNNSTPEEALEKLKNKNG